MRKPDAAVAVTVGLLLSGCSLAPEYKRPVTPAADSYKEVPEGWTVATPSLSASSVAWWSAFNDPILNDIEARVEGANPSLAAAIARLDRAEQQVRVERADYAPQVSVGGQASRDRGSASQPLNITGLPRTYNEYQAGINFNWEIDLFGRIRNSVATGRALAQASSSDVAGVRLSVEASVASDYFQLRGLEARQELLRQTVDAYQRAYDLTETRHKRGRSSAVDSSRALTQLNSAQAELVGVRAQRAAFEHAVATLVGESASTFSVGPASTEAAVPNFPISTPSTLLERRPDISAAERRVAAANAQIGVARAALYPSLSLTGDGGYLTTNANLFTTPNAYWAVGPTLAQSVFDAGKRRAQVRIARAEFDEAAADYRETVLVAFREVEDVLARERDLVMQERDQREAVDAARRTRDLALIRYREGASDYLEVVTAQAAALDAERLWIDLRTQRFTAAVESVRALGGLAEG
jgi:multidrug efflux system outer membrane protein